MFPNFVGPNYISIKSFDKLGSELRLLILQFGYTEVNTWTDLLVAWNAPEEDWKDYLAWLSTNPGYTLDGGVSVKPFPVPLLEWLTSSCTDTSSCNELKVLFNKYSAVCLNSACSADVSGYCKQVDSSSACATSS